MKRLVITAILTLITISPDFIQAQWSIAPHIVISLPRSDFANVSGTGGGFGVKVLRRINVPGGLALRGDFAFLSHGKEFDTVQNNLGQSFLAEIRHESFRLTFGPQFSLGTRNFNVNASVLGGFYIFRTNENVNTSFGFFQESSGEAALGWHVGGGFQYDIGIGPWLDVAFEYQSIYNVPQTKLIKDESGNVDKVSTDITAHEYVIKVGLIFFIGR